MWGNSFQRKVLAIGASTGGPQALGELLRSMPPTTPAILIVQHIPSFFVKPLVKHLDLHSEIQVKIAEDGEQVVPSKAFIAPGNQHMLLGYSVNRGGLHICLRDGKKVSCQRPSVDVLFSSVARTLGKDAVGVLLTGMGEDGARGLLEMKQHGAITLAQDEASCVIYGMPQAARKLKAVDYVESIERIGRKALSCARA